MRTRKLTHTTMTTVAVLGTTAERGADTGLWWRDPARGGGCALSPVLHRKTHARTLRRHLTRKSLKKGEQSLSTGFKPTSGHFLPWATLVPVGWPAAMAVRSWGRALGRRVSPAPHPPPDPAGPAACPQAYLRTGGGWPGCDLRDRQRRDAPGGRTAAGRPCGWRAPWGWPCE